MSISARFLLLLGLLGVAKCGSDRLVERPINLVGRKLGNVLDEFRSSTPALFAAQAANEAIQPVDPPQHSAGYFKLSGTKDSHMFYFFFKSRSNDKTAPLVLWTNGGPGCSSEMGVFYEQGPYQIEDDLTLSLRETGWDSVSNMIFVDQPIGTGFSYSKDASDHRHISRKGVAQDVLEFMREFYKAHPDMADRDFYVSGESYAGHYVPGIAHAINDANKAGDEPKIPLAGIAIGNGLTNPKIQYGAYADFAYQNGLISETLHSTMKKGVSTCNWFIGLCASYSPFCYLGLILCENTQFRPILTANPGLNYYNVKEKCVGDLCYDFSSMTKYLNQPKVKEELNVTKEWVECDKGVYTEMLSDWMLNYQDDVAVLMQDGIRVLIYAGNYDLICNWLGNRRWVDTLDWEGAAEWKSEEDFDWKVKGEYAGKVKETKAMDLVFVEVDKAGHMVPMDKPAQALDMITKFLTKTSFKEQAPALAQSTETVFVS